MTDYDAPRTTPLTPSRTAAVPATNNTAVAYTPTDRVRWPAILAGLFVAMSTLVLMGALGIAIGLSSYDANDSGRAFAVGSGIWAAVTALLAFFFGGLVAGRSAALPGRAEGLFNGFMVWAVAIPLSVYLAASLAGSLVNTIGATAATATQAASQVAGGAAAGAGAAADQAVDSANQNPGVVDDAKRQVNDAADSVKNTAQDLKNKAQNVTGQDVREGVAKAAANSRGSAWGTLITLVVALAASAIGGAVGARDEDYDRRHANVA